jgi:hypothetical protein
MRCQDDRGAHTSFTKAQSQLAAVLHAIPRKTEFDLWPMEFGITPTLSTVIDNISDIHIKALLFELNLIRVDAKSHTLLVITTRDTFMNIANYLPFRPKTSFDCQRGNLKYSVFLLYDESYVLSVFMLMIEV